ncbi:hypothetical protein C492_08580 [Natronococcus jeotgali DSM 18795]|uniref:Uncharacterized protein n=1 Tax=Natronococcus jeotgali DSM 18795 TaxID=1227498 RepID=L9XK07_9EURY|nr:hypothetical protein C492_08580 [Natronococcus jeotgali DSM 18795]
MDETDRRLSEDSKQRSWLIGEYEHTPLITADNTLTLLKKETRIR